MEVVLYVYRHGIDDWRLRLRRTLHSWCHVDASISPQTAVARHTHAKPPLFRSKWESDWLKLTRRRSSRNDMTLVVGCRTFQASPGLRHSALLRSRSRSSVRPEDPFSPSDRRRSQFSAFNRLAMRPPCSSKPQHDARKMVVSK